MAARKKAAADEEAPVIDRYAPYSKLPIAGRPPEPLRSYEGRGELGGPEFPHFFPELTATQFIWLWRVVEAKAWQHWSSPSTAKMIPEQVEVALGTAQAFRLAAGTVTDKLAKIGSKKKTFTRR